jgi:hypothetical protein
LKVDNNYNVANFSFVSCNDEQGIQVNVTMQLKKPLKSWFCYVRLTIPEDKNDQNYRRELFKTSVDVEKTVKNMDGTFIAKLFLEQILTVADFEFKFPIKEGIYHFTNVSITDKYFPFPISTKLMVEARNIGKIVGKKTSIHIFTYRAYVDINKNQNDLFGLHNDRQ